MSGHCFMYFLFQLSVFVTSYYYRKKKNWCWKMVSFIFDYNIKKWQKNLLLSFSRVTLIFPCQQLRNSKKFSASFQFFQNSMFSWCILGRFIRRPLKVCKIWNQTFFRLLHCEMGNKFAQKLQKCQFLINVLILWDVLSHTWIFLLLLINNLISFYFFIWCKQYLLIFHQIFNFILKCWNNVINCFWHYVDR